ncbi:Trk system potassium transporter TrkA [Denitromonas ohlonensis]|uniref:Trk system potassium uptake protein TrkA n=2 Tax=Denitromonas TaxID=139331 RepID=A0A557S3Q1_9RHOO|nr:Trk system potassium transporter TrkA [Denitromonas ohlonensis]TVO67422.1 Trk system potassium transporter TrkA [Denitromonas ohlonensis]TVO72041.1 Trk system potassium transporter TrkA [Denitromonas ohlonensis]TVT51207.1 MAG: Trk system potassium transporter TrkA [Denitromonas halophila]TVT71356.1 MAG: Trk system potassium transporter TrkA [Denitromonas halophila]
MKIILLGAGQVGASVAENLVSEANDITMVDTDADHLATLRDRLDLRTVCGNAASPSVLKEAGADDADLLIAVTQSDQTNLCACRIARTLFNLPTRIARLRSSDFVDHPELLSLDNFAVDFSICPEQIVTDYIRRLIEFPEALQVVDFADGALSLIAVRAFEGGPLVGHPIKALRYHMPNIEVRVSAIYRDGEPIIPEGDTFIKPGDEVFCLAASANIRRVMRELTHVDRPMRRIMIAGGGNIGLRLARAIEKDYEVKVLEYDKRRAEMIAIELNDTLVLRGDSTDENLLENENIDEMDMFVALTNDEEDNIMSASLAKRMGARRTLALINRKSYVDLVQGGHIDIAISPAQTSIGSLLAHVRRGDVVAVHSLRRGAAEALEIIAHGDEKNSKVVGRAIEDIRLPRGATIGAIVRMEDVTDDSPGRPTVLMAHHDTVIKPEDHLIVFCTSKKLVRQVEKLFQVDFSFF